MTDVSTTGALVKVVDLRCSAATAFELFTARMGAWWPLEAFSVGGESSAGVHVEGRGGGRLVETLGDGTTSIWGTVTRWEPPGALALTWHPGRGEDEATLVEVLFEGRADGVRVTLTHSGFAGASGREARDRYDSGWDVVLAPFVAALKSKSRSRSGSG